MQWNFYHFQIEEFREGHTRFHAKNMELVKT